MRSDASRSDYTAARRAVGNQVLLRKVESYGGQVASCKGDQKKLCCLMNNLMGRDSPTSLPYSESDIQLALDFSWFFQSKVLWIREELDGTPVHGDYSVEFHPQQSVRSLFLKFNPVDELSIRRYIRELNKTYCSLDPINVSKITVTFEAADETKGLGPWRPLGTTQFWEFLERNLMCYLNQQVSILKLFLE